jgi:hypothetical protein
VAAPDQGVIHGPVRIKGGYELEEGCAGKTARQLPEKAQRLL